MYFYFPNFSNKVNFVENVTLEARIKDLVVTGHCTSASSLVRSLESSGVAVSRRHVLRTLDHIFGGHPVNTLHSLRDAENKPLNVRVIDALEKRLRANRVARTLIAQSVELDDSHFVVVHDLRGERWWAAWEKDNTKSLIEALMNLHQQVGKNLYVIPHGPIHEKLAGLSPPSVVTIVDWAHAPLPYEPPTREAPVERVTKHNHLDTLEAESIRIIREAVAVAKNPGMLFSMGKDSMVMLTLARKAFWPEPVPFPLVMIDTRWKFQDMYRFRHWIETRPDLNVIVHINPDAIRDDINPFDHGSAHHTDVTKTLALKQVLGHHQFDFVFGGARRDEEKSRAKERVFSVRGSNHGWDPKNQRPELWNVYNTRLSDGQSMRVFPISNWTELDVWRYVEREDIPVVPLYFSKMRPFVERNGSLIMVDDERFPLEPHEQVFFEPIRFRTLGCYPLTGGVRSDATTVSDIIRELELSRVSERSSRVIDFDQGASMEQKKKEGYF